MTKKMEI